MNVRTQKYGTSTNVSKNIQIRVVKMKPNIEFSLGNSRKNVQWHQVTITVVDRQFSKLLWTIPTHYIRCILTPYENSPKPSNVIAYNNNITLSSFKAAQDSSDSGSSHV